MKECRKIELLAPAKNVETGMEAIRHGADAVYIGAEKYGARAAAGNSLEDLALLVDYAHLYRVRVYVTVNTILKDEELPAGSYVMSNNGVLTRLKSSVTAKPFRAYLRMIGNGANAKPLTTMGFSDSEGETTSVEEILQDNGIILESSDVYGVNGVKVRSNTHSLEGLSKGVYVVNGKKYVVK